MITFLACRQNLHRTDDRQQWEEILIKDLDYDGKMDTIFLDRAYLECKLSTLDYKPIRSHNEYDYLMRLKSTDCGFSFSVSWDAETVGEYEFRYNQKEKNMQLVSAKVFVGVDENTLESECYFKDEKWECSDCSHNPSSPENKSEAVFLDSDNNNFF